MSQKALRYPGIGLLVIVLQIASVGCGGGGNPPPQVGQAGQALQGADGAPAGPNTNAGQDSAFETGSVDPTDATTDADDTVVTTSVQGEILTPGVGNGGGVNATTSSNDVRAGLGGDPAAGGAGAGTGDGTQVAQAGAGDGGTSAQTGLVDPGTATPGGEGEKGAGTAPAAGGGANGTGATTPATSGGGSPGATGIVQTPAKKTVPTKTDFPTRPVTTSPTPPATARWMGLSKAQRLTEADDYLRRQGLSKRGRAMLLGAMWRESAMTLDPRIHQQGGGPGVGIMQWTADADHKSFQALQRWAYERGTTWDDINAQLSFAVNQNTALTGRLQKDELDNGAAGRAKAIQIVYEMEHQAVKNDKDRDEYGDRIFANLSAGKPAGTGFSTAK